MPIYEYQCQACGHQFETTQRITEDPLKDCPACNKPQLERLISATAFLLKGGGWYKDGYGSSTNKRTDNQVGDRLAKAVNDDKKKTAEAASDSGSSSSSTDSSSSSAISGTSSATTTPTSGGSSSGGSST